MYTNSYRERKEICDVKISFVTDFIMKKFLILLSVLWMNFLFAQTNGTSLPIVNTATGLIQGTLEGDAKTKEDLFASFGDLENCVKSAYDPDGNKEFNEIITKFNTDWVWGESSRMTAKAFLAKGASAYMYQFGYVLVTAQQRSPYGAGHGSEVSFVFNTLNARWGPPAEPTAQEKELARIMCGYWANFARTGNPNGQGLPNWPLYNIQNQDMPDIELDGKVIAKPDPRKVRFDVIEKAMKKRGKIQVRGI